MARKAAPKRIRVKTGFAGGPTTQFEHFNDYVRTDVAPKDIIQRVKAYAKRKLSKDDFAIISYAPDWKFNRHNVAAADYWKNVLKNEFVGRIVDVNYIAEDGKTTGTYKKEYRYDGDALLKRFLAEILAEGEVYKQKHEDEEARKALIETKKKVVPAEKALLMKVRATAIETVEDMLMDFNQKRKISLEGLMASHSLARNAIPFIRSELQLFLDDYEGAYKKKDPQLVEGYSHLDRATLRGIVNFLTQLISECDAASAPKAKEVKARKPRNKKPIDKAKMVSLLRFLDKDDEFDIKSVDPTTIVGAKRVIAYNTKYKQVCEYVSTAEGFIVKGTTLHDMDKEKCRATKLRKPEQIMQTLKTGTPKMIDTAWANLTTKTYTGINGRFNENMIILRVFDK